MKGSFYQEGYAVWLCMNIQVFILFMMFVTSQLFMLALLLSGRDNKRLLCFVHICGFHFVISTSNWNQTQLN